MDTTEYVVIAIVTMAGLMRGITGFGGAMLMAPLLSAILGPVATVLTALLLETSAGLMMVPDAWSKIDRKLLSYLIVPACITVPIGGHLLLNLDPGVTRKAISRPRRAVQRRAAVRLPVFRLAAAVDLDRTRCAARCDARRHQRRGAARDPLSSRRPLATRGDAGEPDGPRHRHIRHRRDHAAPGRRGDDRIRRPCRSARPALLAATWIGGHLFARLNEFGARRVTLGLALISGIAGFVV